MCQHCQTLATLVFVSAKNIIVTLAYVSALLITSNPDNSDLCVSIVNSTVISTLAYVSALSKTSWLVYVSALPIITYPDNSGLCVSIVNSTVLATLAYVSALPISMKPDKSGLCVRIVIKKSRQLWPLCQHCQQNVVILANCQKSVTIVISASLPPQTYQFQQP